MATSPTNLYSLEPANKNVKAAHGKSTNNTTTFEEESVQTQVMTRQHETISLLPAEQLLRQLLLDCRNNMLQSDPAAPKLEIWFTGGWVRDKLLGIQSPDIDAALSTMTGVQFGNVLENYFHMNESKYLQEAHKLGVRPEFRRLHQTTKNPDKSKHLETAIAHVFGLDLDLVNLRDEVYTESSRNPQIKFGTVENDAFRRDATVNALFYDLDKQRVEDFTGKGLQDMAAGILRTPLDPHQTFVDDPLRVLRLIRFAGRLGYTIDVGAQQAMKDEMIHAAFTTKITRERVQIEVVKMMNGRNPLMAFELIHELDLYSTVFLNPTSQLCQSLHNLLPNPQQSDRPWPATWHHAYRVLAALSKDTTSLGKELARSEEKGENCWVMAAWAPIAELRRQKLEEAVRTATEAIKATKKMSKLLEDALKHVDEIRSTVDLVAAQDGSKSLSRSTVGMAIRSWGATWRLQVLYSLLAEVVYEVSGDGFFAAQLQRYSIFLNYVLQQELQAAPAIKPILNGDDVKRIFKLDKSGAFLKTALDGVVRWQFDNKDGTKDEAVEWLRTQKEAFGIP